MYYLLLIIVCVVELGWLGRLSLESSLVPNLFVVLVWALAWFRTRRQALPLSISGGLILDLAGFSSFGLWTLIALIIVGLISSLKSRFLDTSSIIHALITLTLSSLIAIMIVSFRVGSFNLGSIGAGVLANVITGAVIYYLLAMRMRLFSRWAGRRID